MDSMQMRNPFIFSSMHKEQQVVFSNQKSGHRHQEKKILWNLTFSLTIFAVAPKVSKVSNIFMRLTCRNI